MNFGLFFLLLLVTLFSVPQTGFSQARPVAKDSVIYRIETDDGNVYQGYILDQKPEYVLLSTEQIGTITIQFEHIVKMEMITGSSRKLVGGVTINYSRPQETTYHFLPNGYGLKKGEGYYQNCYLFLNQFYAGVTDYFSLGGGLVPLPLEGMPIWISPKFSIPILKDKVNLGVGSLNGYTLGTYGEAFGIFYGNLTFGSRERNFSIGAGKPYNNGFDNTGLALSVSGAYRLGEYAYVVTENFTMDGLSVGTAGGRHVWPNMSLEYSFIYIYEYDLFVAFPYVGVIVPFGHKQ